MESTYRCDAMEITNMTNPAKTHGLKIIWNIRWMMVSILKLTGPSVIMPYLSMTCAAALVMTVNRMNGIYFVMSDRSFSSLTQ